MGWSVRLKNEFGAVEVSLDLEGNTPRLLVREEHTGTEIRLDPLELSALTTCVHADFAPFMEALRIPGSIPGEPEVQEAPAILEGEPS